MNVSPVENKASEVGATAPSQAVHAPKGQNKGQIDAAVIAFLVLEETQTVISKTARLEGKNSDNIVAGAERRDLNKMRAFDGFKPIYATTTRSPTYTTESLSSWDVPHHHGGTIHHHNVKTAAEDQGRLKQINEERGAINQHFGVENQQTQIIDSKLNVTSNASAMTSREATSILHTYAQLMYKVLMTRQPQV